jgi:hypothetical protein
MFSNKHAYTSRRIKMPNVSLAKHAGQLPQPIKTQTASHAQRQTLYPRAVQQKR